VLERFATAIAPAVSVVCGPPRDSAVARLGVLSGFFSYFEVAVQRPALATIGIALSQEPEARGASKVSLDHLLDVPLDLQVRLHGVDVPASALDLDIGAIVPITETAVFEGTLSVAGSTLALGECGVQGNRYAIAIRTSPLEGSSEPAS
jgi:flagellar motor switch/type III secretory pathway protein FliN